MTKIIGKLTDTPDTGDPILSPWYQEIATYARHIFANKAELDAQWSDAPNGAHAWTTTEQMQWHRIGGAWVASLIQSYPTLAALKAATVPNGASGVVLDDPRWGVLTRYSTGWSATRVDLYSGTTDSAGRITLTAASFGFASIRHVAASGSIAFGTDIAGGLAFARTVGANIEVYFLKIKNDGLGAYDNNKAVQVTLQINGTLT